MSGMENEAQQAPGVEAQLQQTQVRLQEVREEITSFTDLFKVPEAQDATDLVSSAIEALTLLGTEARNADGDPGAPALQAVTALSAAQLHLESAELQIRRPIRRRTGRRRSRGWRWRRLSNARVCTLFS